MYKKGLSLSNKDLILQGIQQLNIAFACFQKMNNEDALQKVSNTITLAKDSLEKL